VLLDELWLVVAPHELQPSETTVPHELQPLDTTVPHELQPPQQPSSTT